MFPLIIKLKQSRLFKDSFWAVFGNGAGNALMLFSSILIARFLGKDLYGEYGVVKSTMFYIASFATFGLGFTSTKYIAQYTSEQRQYVKSIMRDSMIITLVFSGIIASFLIVYAQRLADYVGEPTLKIAFQALAGIIIFKAITTTQIGLLSGYKKFKVIARNSVVSGLLMFIICVPFCYFYGLRGALTALMLSQAFNAFINYISINRVSASLPKKQIKKGFKRELISFSFPVALQESSYTVCHWFAIMLLTKYASVGELGLYSAGAQWNSIIMMIPVLLNNVVLSYLSANISNKIQHVKTVKVMLLTNFICTMVPFILVYIFAGVIAQFYGATFSELPTLLRVITLSTIFECCTSVFKSELMSQGRTWLLFSLRCLRDASLVVLVYGILNCYGGESGAIYYAWTSVTVSAFFLIIMSITYHFTSKNDT